MSHAEKIEEGREEDDTVSIRTIQSALGEREPVGISSQVLNLKQKMQRIS
jgi:hypothetical protein